jgi:hypothetical protein
MNAQPAGWYPDPYDAAQFRYWDGRAWTEHRSPRFQAVAPAFGVRPPLPPPGPTGKWYFVITFVSIGLLASVPFFHAASRLDRPGLRRTGAWLAGTGLVGWVLIMVSPSDDQGDPTGWLPSVATLLLLAVVVFAAVKLVGLRREVYPNPAPTFRPPTGNEAAMAGVEEARRRRDEARRLALRDPMMARELGIGRPGSKQFDDGGLLDLNLATEDELTAICRLPREAAGAVVAARARLGRFLQVDDAIAFGQVSEEHVPMVRDRGIVIAER